MATLEITTTPAQDARIAEAFGEKLMLFQNATLPQVRQHIIDYIINVVLEHERRKALDAAVIDVTPIDVT